MSIELSIDNVFDKFQDDIIRLSNKQLSVVTRQALNRTITPVRTEARKLVQKKLNLKLKDINRKEMLKLNRASGTSISKMTASVTFSATPISLINFLRDKKPQRQAYVPVKKRKPVKIKVGNKRTTLKTAFIQRGKKNKNGEGNVHVFKRIGGRTYWKKQSAPSLAALFDTQNMHATLAKKAEVEFEKQFKTRLDYELSKIGKSKR